MGIWSQFFKSINNQSLQKIEHQLHQEVINLLPQYDEEKQLLLACIAGLMARVAYVDFHVHESELKYIEGSLVKWMELTEKEAQVVSSLAISHIKDLAGLENHLYCHALNNILDNTEKYKLLESLFAVAASDGEVEHNEVEEIRQIAHSLTLEHKYFISAKATVIDSLNSLKA